MAKFRKKDQSENSERQPAASGFAGDTTVGSPDRERLASRAYELYQARGAGDGGDLDDWLTAERELINPEDQRNESEE